MMCSMSTISCKTAYCSFTYFSPAPWGNQASLPKFFQNPSISNADYDRLQVLLLFLRKLQSISHASEAPHSFFLLLSRALYSTVFVLIEGFLTDKLIDCFRGCVAHSLAPNLTPNGTPYTTGESSLVRIAKRTLCSTRSLCRSGYLVPIENTESVQMQT